MFRRRLALKISHVPNRGANHVESTFTSVSDHFTSFAVSERRRDATVRINIVSHRPLRSIQGAAPRERTTFQQTTVKYHDDESLLRMQKMFVLPWGSVYNAMRIRMKTLTDRSDCCSLLRVVLHVRMPESLQEFFFSFVASYAIHHCPNCRPASRSEGRALISPDITSHLT